MYLIIHLVVKNENRMIRVRVRMAVFDSGQTNNNVKRDQMSMHTVNRPFFRAVPVFEPPLISEFSCITLCKWLHNFR